MTDKELSGRNRLKEAMKLSDQTYLDKYPPIENEVKYSEKYLKYIDRLTKQTKSPFYKYFNTIGKRVAGFAAAMLIAFSCSMTVKAIREPVVEFFANIYEKFVEIFFEEDDIAKAPDTIETVYTLGYVPEGYELIEQKIANSGVDFTWQNSKGEIICFSQDILRGEATLDYEDSNYSIVYISDIKIAYVDKWGHRALFWNTSSYAFSMVVSMDLSLEECIHLIESMTSMQKSQ